MHPSPLIKERGQPLHSFITLLILLLAAFLRFYHLSGQSLWADEGNSAALINHSFLEIARRTAFDIHPPLYYWLLKIWTFFFGVSEVGLRSLSAGLGVGLVYIIGRLGAGWFNPRVGLLAALLAAVSPLQIYYAQEARMYMLLAFQSSLTVLLAWLLWQGHRPLLHRNSFWLRSPPAWIYLLVVTAGLYTHYAYPIILLIVNGAALIWFWLGVRKRVSPSPVINWLVLQILPLLLYLPWLPIAWRQITTWPAENQSASLLEMLEVVATTLLGGLSWPFDSGWLFAALLILIVIVAVFFASSGTRYRSPLALLLLWFLLPVALTLIIFSPAFLKFLLVASPAVTLLLALSVETISNYFWRVSSWRSYYDRRPFLRRLLGSTWLFALISASMLAVYQYYTNPVYARDDYRRIVNFIKATAGPDDAVILNAEGQQDVFNYYYRHSPTPAAPVYPLPRRRPLDEPATQAELERIAGQAGKVYGVYWATRQADPAGFIERWLDSHLFKATDQWYGNVRLVTYASPSASPPPLTPVKYQFGPHIQLVGYAVNPPQLTPGDILQVTLSWKTAAPLQPDEDYTVFTQVLDQANHLVGQRDAAPLTPTSGWPVGQPMVEGHGIFIEPGTPPGPHRLIVGLYNSQTGERLPVAGGGDFVELGQVMLNRPSPPLPPEALKMQVTLNAPLGEVTLLGYDLYKVGHRSTPDTPLHPGDPVQLVLYWLAREPVRQLQDQLHIQVMQSNGQATPASVTGQPAGVNYPIGEWRAGEIVRAQFNFFLEDLPPGVYHLALTLDAPQASPQSVGVVTRSFRVE